MLVESFLSVLYENFHQDVLLQYVQYHLPCHNPLCKHKRRCEHGKLLAHSSEVSQSNIPNQSINLTQSLCQRSGTPCVSKNQSVYGHSTAHFLWYLKSIRVGHIRDHRVKPHHLTIFSGLYAQKDDGSMGVNSGQSKFGVCHGSKRNLVSLTERNTI